jgi:hypothetical protein
MKRRAFFGALLAGGSGLIGLAGRSCSAASNAPKIHVKKISVTPRALTGSGGIVSVKIQVTGKVKGVDSVRIRATLTGGTMGNAATLTAGKGQTYSGTCLVPANHQLSSVQATFTVYVTVGGDVSSYILTSLPVGPGSDARPPDPPPNN